MQQPRSCERIDPTCLPRIVHGARFEMILLFLGPDSWPGTEVRQQRTSFLRESQFCERCSEVRHLFGRKCGRISRGPTRQCRRGLLTIGAQVPSSKRASRDDVSTKQNFMRFGQQYIRQSDAQPNRRNDDIVVDRLVQSDLARASYAKDLNRRIVTSCG